MTCRPVTDAEFDDYLIQFGKDVVAVLSWLSSLT
jgi:hypothetical protein